ncbi:MAG: type II toxin-antitoxin system HicB family antitoxin [Thermoleophilaceae bacterium]
MGDQLTFKAVATPDESAWTIAQLADRPGVVACGRTVDEAREMVIDAGETRRDAS